MGSFGVGCSFFLVKKAIRRITITFPSSPCPRAWLVIEAGREGAIGPSETRSWLPEKIFSWFWHWHLNGSWRLLKFSAVSWESRQNSTDTTGQAAFLPMHPSVRLLRSLSLTVVAGKLPRNYSFLCVIPELGNLRTVPDQNYSEFCNPSGYFSPLSILLLAFYWAKLTATANSAINKIPISQFHPWAMESTSASSRDSLCS